MNKCAIETLKSVIVKSFKAKMVFELNNKDTIHNFCKDIEMHITSLMLSSVECDMCMYNVLVSCWEMNYNRTDLDFFYVKLVYTTKQEPYTIEDIHFRIVVNHSGKFQIDVM